MPKVHNDADGKPTHIVFGSDEEFPKDAWSGWTMQASTPLEYDVPMGISVIITHTALGWSVSVKSKESYVYESMPEARDAVRRWLRHWAESSIEIDEVRNFHSPDRFIPADDSVPGG